MKKNQKISVNRLIELLRNKKMSQCELSFVSGVSTVTISNIMNNKTNPSYATITALATALEVFPEYLTCEIDYKNYKDWKNKDFSNRLTPDQLTAVLSLLTAWGFEIIDKSNNFITVIAPSGQKTKLYIKHLSNISDTFITLINNALLPAELFNN